MSSSGYCSGLDLHQNRGSGSNSIESFKADQWLYITCIVVESSNSLMNFSLHSGQVRLGIGAYAGAARRRVHLDIGPSLLPAGPH